MRVNLPLDSGVFIPDTVPLVTPPNEPGVIQKQIGVVRLSRERDGTVMADAQITDSAYNHMDNEMTHSVSLSGRQRPMIDLAMVTLLPVWPTSDVPVYEEDPETGDLTLVVPMVDIGCLRFRREAFEDHEIEIDKIVEVLETQQFKDRGWSYTITNTDTEVNISWRAKNEGTI